MVYAAALTIGLLALCVLGMAMFVVGVVFELPGVEKIGAWLTLPLTVIMGAAVAGVVITWPLAGLWRLAELLLGRRRR